MFVAAVAALVASSTPAAAPPIVAVHAAPAATRSPTMPDLATIFAMFDKLFPPLPDPDPARLSLARTTVQQGLLPSGSFRQAMGSVTGAMIDRVLTMKESDFADIVPHGKPAKGEKPKPPSTRTLHQSLIDDDPYFDERMRLTRGAIETELVKLSAIIEPRLQEGLARAVARRFEARQLTDINAFFATASGKALGRQYMALWFDPDLSRAMMAGIPEMIALAPGAMERVEAATAGLPKPKSKAQPVEGDKPALKRKP